MHYKTLISEYGQSKLAEELGIPGSQVSHWVHGVRPIPVKYCQLIKSRIDGVTLQMLRPDDWKLYWPNLSKPKTQTTEA
jgi:DNA-binding transcriptional regulator YdaS (Cro superfamily)